MITVVAFNSLQVSSCLTSYGNFNRTFVFFLGTLSSIEDAQRFESVFKMPRRAFDYVCSLVKDEMMVRSSSYAFLDGTVLSLEDRVAISLRRLNSGGSLVTVGSSVGVNFSTVSLITWRFIEAMEERVSHHLHWPDWRNGEDQIQG